MATKASASERSTYGKPPELTPAQAAAVLSKPTLTIEEAAWYLGVSRRWLVREGVRKGKVPFLRPPGSNKLLFRRAHLDAVIESWVASDGIGTPPGKKLANSRNRK